MPQTVSGHLIKTLPMKIIFGFVFLFLFNEIFGQIPKADFDFVVVYECGYAFVGMENKSVNADSCFWKVDGWGYEYLTNPNPPIGNFSNNKDRDIMVSLIVKGDGITDSITKYFSLRQTRVEFEFKIQDSLNFAPVTIEFINKSLQRNGDTLSYHWDFNDGFTSDEENPSHAYSIPGTYYPTLSGITQNGCTLYSFLPITVRDTAQKNEIYYITGLHTTSVEYPFEQFDTIQNDTLKITGYILSNCCTYNTAVIYKSPDTIFIKTFETGPECTCEDFFDFEIKIPSIYKDSIWVSFNGHIVIAKKILTSIGKSAITEPIKIFPNPASESLNIDLIGYKFNLITIKIFDLLGHKVFEASQTQNQKVIIDDIFLNPGVYIVNFTFDNDKSYSSKLLIKNAL
jgi:hypothetical protein